MRERLFEGRLVDEIAQGDRGYRERLKSAARLLVGIIRDGLVRDGLVRIHGFGSFHLRPMKARAGVNPRTGERITIPARQRVLFRPAKALRERIEPGRPRALPVAEPHASREATLATAALEIPRAPATVPSPHGAPVHRGGHARTDTGGGYEPQGSREAALHGATQGPYAAGGLAPDEPGSDVGGGHDGAPPPAPSDAYGAGHEPGAVADERAPEDRRGAVRWGMAALLVVVLALLAWWLWPGPRPQPQVAQAPATSGESADTAVAQGDATPTEGAGTGDAAGDAVDDTETPAAAEEDRAADGDAGGVAREPDAIADAAAAAGDADREAAADEARAGAAAGDAAADTQTPAAAEEDRAAEGDAGGVAREPDAIADAAAAAGDADREAAANEARAGAAAGDAAADAQTPAAAGDDRAAAGDAGGVAQEPDAIADAAGAAGDTDRAPGAGAADDARAGEAAGEAGAEARAPESPATAAGAGPAAEAPASAAVGARAPGAESADAPDTAPAGDTPGVASAAAATPEAGASAPAAGTDAAEPAAGGEATPGEPYFGARDYSVRRGDTLWDLAARYYGDPYYWPHVWNHNEGLADPDLIRVDQGLRLPALEGGPGRLTAADRRSIAEGYLRLYRFFRERGHASPRDALVAARRFDASVIPEGLRRTAGRSSIDR